MEIEAGRLLFFSKQSQKEIGVNNPYKFLELNLPQLPLENERETSRLRQKNLLLGFIMFQTPLLPPYVLYNLRIPTPVGERELLISIVKVSPRLVT